MKEAQIFFEIDRTGDREQQWVWRIRSHGDNEVLVSSEVLGTREAAENAMRLVRDNAGLCSRVWDQTVVPQTDWVPFP